MIPSSFQTAIFDEVVNGNSNMMISAVAGSGKTTTIVKAISLIPSTKSVIMLAFNKKIADELQNRVKLHNVQIKTFHAIGLQVIRNSICKNPKVDSFKIDNIINEYCNFFAIHPETPGISKCKKILSIGKSSGVGIIKPNTNETWNEIIAHHDIFSDEDPPDMEVVMPLLVKCLNKNNKITNVIDFDDMVYFPIFFGCNFPKFNWVFADEVQDASEINREALRALMATDSRLCVVGDPFQAIYGFRGADSNSMSSLRQEFNCKELPLSVSYRCAKAVVKEAQRVVNHILPSDTSPDGEVIHLSGYTQDIFRGDSAIVCRNTAPLVEFTYSLIHRGVPAVMLGRDIGKGLVTLIKSLKCKEVSQLPDAINYWTEKSIQKAASKGDEGLIDSIRDKSECCKLFVSMTKCSKVSDLIQEVESFFKETAENGKVTLCTVHKSKGLEWEKVFILDSGRFYPKWATMSWMKEQERNIHYVALTRAKNSLIYIKSDDWK